VAGCGKARAATKLMSGKNRGKGLPEAQPAKAAPSPATTEPMFAKIASCDFGQIEQGA
jgi:hypothetical protein